MTFFLNFRYWGYILRFIVRIWIQSSKLTTFWPVYPPTFSRGLSYSVTYSEWTLYSIDRGRFSFHFIFLGDISYQLLFSTLSAFESLVCFLYWNRLHDCLALPNSDIDPITAKLIHWCFTADEVTFTSECLHLQAQMVVKVHFSRTTESQET